jgi:hypothetical protein
MAGFGMKKTAALIFGLVLGLAWADASLGSADALSFRRNDAGQFEAVLSGLTDFCGYVGLSGVDSIQRNGTAISINSIAVGFPGGCAAPPPGSSRFEIVAILGNLPTGTYTVYWTASSSATGARSVLAGSTLVTDSFLPNPVPAGSALTLAIAALLVGITGAYVTLRATGRAGPVIDFREPPGRRAG